MTAPAGGARYPFSSTDPGLGTRLATGLKKREHAIVRRSV
jgi:hypothetical protein